MTKLINSVSRELFKIQSESIEQPTHLLIPNSVISILLEEYEEILGEEIDYDSIYQYGYDNVMKKEVSLKEIQEFLGIMIVIDSNEKGSIKILKEIKTDTGKIW